MPQSSSVCPTSPLANAPPSVVFTTALIKPVVVILDHSGVAQSASVLCAICQVVLECVVSPSVPSEKAVPESVGLLLPPAELPVGVDGPNFTS